MVKVKDQKDNDSFRISLKSVFYSLKIHHRAAGKKTWIIIFDNILSSVTPAIIALLAGQTITSLIEAVSTKNPFPTLILLGIIFAIQLLTTILSQIKAIIREEIIQEIFCTVSSDVARKYISIPLAMRETQEFADKFNRVKEYGVRVDSISNRIFSVIGGFISLFTVLITTFALSKIATLIIIIVTIPYAIIGAKITAKRTKNWRKYTNDRRIAYDIEQKITSSNSALEIELNGLSDYLINKMIGHRRKSEKQDIKDAKEFFIPKTGSRLLEQITSFGMLAYVAHEIIIEKLEIGYFYTFKNLFDQLGSNIYSLSMHITNLAEDLVNATDYMDFMETQESPNGTEQIVTLPKIEFRNVSFSYPNSKTLALDNVSFTINPGENLAIVGENGAGKTTIIKLLIGAYTPTSGTIFINDIPFSQIDRHTLLNQIGALFQDFSKYDFATIGENVWYGNVTKPYSENEIRESIAKAGLDYLEPKFEKGLNQILSKNYDKKYTADLSGGEWQRLAIARGFFRSPNILILDEPTSAVDAKSEYSIFKEIMKEQKTRTTVIISHRFSTVRKADKILVLSHGKVTETGSHADLLKHGGLYKEMFELQAEGYL